MNDIYITLTGNVAAEPRQYTFEDGARVTSLRVLTSHRYFDRKTGQWTDGERVCFAVRCWRSLGDNVARSIRMGHPVVVSGKLRIREFGPEGDRRFMPEIEASAVGHDLRWGAGTFVKPERTGGPATVSKEMRDRLDAETEDWAMGGTTHLPASRSAMASDGAAMAATASTTENAGTAIGNRTTHPFPEPPADPHPETETPTNDNGPAAAQNGETPAIPNGEERAPTAAAPAPGKPPARPARAKGRPSRADNDNEPEPEDAEWPTREPIAA
ncbi:single-stranded DNA-binding protein [Nonomuraea rhodomycinica]|uniref:Single-stranded DNA-binding protein n=1 Tax=Nonomuraea rhodomycinica TaxID=1712872 RepID=A0A7Y6IRM6_9ACTN|nr:single-stranded DNA-binding protein [Nonomuraea rhodomycinica]NUW42623.1 single-stranded DNA-binding protein [Nonomuraea rhodomycinica]